MKKNRLVIIIAVVVVALALWLVFGGGDAVTRAFLDLPDGTVSIETATGDVLELEVKVAPDSQARNNAFRGVDPEAIEEHVLYMAYPFAASVAHRSEDLKTAVDMAFFDDEGELLAIFAAEPEDGVGYRPEPRYQYVMMARSGFFSEKEIDQDSRLLLEID